MIEAAPTNSTSGWMTGVPNAPNPDHVPGNYPHPSGTPDFEVDGLADGKDTTGLFKEDGTIRTALPPVTDLSPDRSYILGPMAAMYYTWAYPWTMIGYIRQADRKFVNLARIDGKLNEWDGESGFNSASWGGQLTLEQANWFLNVKKAPGQTNDPATANYRAFYPGPPSNTPDAFGRYYCTITGEPLDGYRPPVGDPWIPPEQGKMSPEDIFSAIMDRLRKGKKLSEKEKQWLRDQGLDDFADGGNTASPLGDLALLGLSYAAAKALVPLLTSAGGSAWNLIKSEWAQRAITDSAWKTFQATGQMPPWYHWAAHKLLPQSVLNLGAKVLGTTPATSILNTGGTAAGTTGLQGGILSILGGILTGDTPQKPKKQLKLSYKPQGQLISESRRSILKNLKKPVVIPETKQKKYKVKPKIRGLHPESKPSISKPVETPKEYKKIGGRDLWGQYEHEQNSRASQERMNSVYELLGDGWMAQEHMLTRSKRLNAEEMEKFWGLHPELYSYFYNGKKYTATRKEEIKGDYLVFLVDENGEKSSILQSELNEKLAEEKEKKELEEYNNLNPKPKRNNRVSYEKDPLFKKVAKKLKKEIDYPEKPAKMGYPNDPPPEMVNDRHPDFGKTPGTTLYNKMSPKTAKAMPFQDDPVIDAKIKKARMKVEEIASKRKSDKSVSGKLNEDIIKSDWKKELKEGMTTGSVMVSTVDGSEDNPTEVTDINTTTADAFEDSEDNNLDNIMFRATDIKANGTGSGDDGGFNIGPHLAVGTETNSDGSHYQGTSTRHAFLKPIDARYIDTMVVTAIRGNGSNGGKLPTSGHIHGQDLRLMWFNEDRVNGWRGIGSWMKINVSGKSPFWTYNKNEDGSDYNSIIIPRYHFKLEYGNEYDLADPEAYPNLREWTIKIPEWCRNKNQRFAFYQYYIGAGGFNYGIKEIKYQRRTPMNVAIPLDDPKAISFIRLGGKEGDPKKRKKALDSQLKSSKQYVNKVVANPFPGTDTEVGEAQGTGKPYVAQQWDDKTGEFAKTGTLDQQKDKFVNKDVKLAPNYSEVQKQINKKKK